MAEVGNLDAAFAAADLAGVNVSRETAGRLALYVALLRKWNPVKNLVAASTLDDIWTRHIADSLQLLRHAPEARIWVDLGSGGGLPALVIAAALADMPGASVHCVESKLGKAAFLREAARQMRVPVTVHADRIEAVIGRWPTAIKPDVVTARALAALPNLLSLASPLLKTGAIGLFPKGQDVGSELTEAAKYWKLDYITVPSATDKSGHIVTIRSAVSLST
ncbi:MAG: 16S rRNA (guanine(527)-N(7))-methyltransferase RsmG [Proteobacteria bacterium]|nr:16S rRNA (guanine(527)-N(7))-methyltransferase RsmG [Pseudomonadota bacterium]